MRYRLTITTVFLLVLQATPPVFAQGAGTQWDILNQEVAELYRTGEYDRALIPAKKALEVAQKNVGPNHPDVATSLNYLGVLYREMGEYGKAEPLYKQATEIYRRAFGEDHPYCATGLNNLAELYRAMGEYAKAEPLFKKAMQICRKALGEEHPDYGATLNNLAWLYYEMGEYAKAEPLMKRHLEILLQSTRETGHRHPRMQDAVDNYTDLLLEMRLSQSEVDERMKRLAPEMFDEAAEKTPEGKPRSEIGVDHTEDRLK